MMDPVVALGGPPPRVPPPEWIVGRASSAHELAAYAALRRRAFVEEQELFADDADERDGEVSTVVLVARDADGCVLGGVRLHPEGPAFWQGSRLVCAPGLGERRGAVGASLVRAACAVAEAEGALRFDATVQLRFERFFSRLGWSRVRDVSVAGAPHVLMRWPVGRIAALAAATKTPLGPVLRGVLGGVPDGWRGDDGVPVPGSDLVAATDAIVPRMVARDPEWAGWCGMLVTANDLAAMGAAGVGALDAVASPDAAHAERVLGGVRAGSVAFGLPVLGGHTTFGAPASLVVTGLGRFDTAAGPVPGGGGRVGDAVSLTADLAGGWRPGYTGAQWDSTSGRRTDELAAMLGAVARARPHAAKDVSMAGVVGSLGMLAEASGCAAELDVAAVPCPRAAGLADWLTCFPGFGMLTADAAGAPPLPAGPAAGAVCGRLVAGAGVTFVWPDGERIRVLDAGVTGLGSA